LERPDAVKKRLLLLNRAGDAIFIAVQQTIGRRLPHVERR
jgi:hypothetical protein